MVQNKYIVKITNNNYKIIFGDNENFEYALLDNYINNINITKSVDNLTNTATFELPLRLNNPYLGESDSFVDTYVPNIIVNGSYVEIDFYIKDLKNNKIANVSNNFFKGFISNVTINGDTITYNVEDYSYWLKKAEINLTRQSISIRELVAIIINNVNQIIPDDIPKMEFETDVDLNIINFNAKRATCTEILQLLLEKYLQRTVLKNNLLVVGLNFNKLETKLKTEAFNNYNLSDLRDYFGLYLTIQEIKDSIKNRVNGINIRKEPRILSPNFKNETIRTTNKTNLVYNNTKDKRYVLNVKNFRKDGSYIVYKLKESSSGELGEERSFVFIGDYNSQEIIQLAENQVKRIDNDGFSDSEFETLFYNIEPNDTILVDMLLKNKEYETEFYNKIAYVSANNKLAEDNKKGEIYNIEYTPKKITLVEDAYYLVNSVSTTFSGGVLRQTIKFGYKLTCDKPDTRTKLLKNNFDFIEIYKTQDRNFNIISKEYESANTTPSGTQPTKNKSKSDENRYLKAYKNAIEEHTEIITQILHKLKLGVITIRSGQFVSLDKVVTYNKLNKNFVWSSSKYWFDNGGDTKAVETLNALLNKEAVSWKNIKSKYNLCRLNKVLAIPIPPEYRSGKLEIYVSYKDLEARNGR